MRPGVWQALPALPLCGAALHFGERGCPTWIWHLAVFGRPRVFFEGLAAEGVLGFVRQACEGLPVKARSSVERFFFNLKQEAELQRTRGIASQMPQCICWNAPVTLLVSSSLALVAALAVLLCLCLVGFLRVPDVTCPQDSQPKCRLDRSRVHDAPFAAREGLPAGCGGGRSHGQRCRRRPLAERQEGWPAPEVIA